MVSEFRNQRFGVIPDVHSDSLTWKWKMAPVKTIFLYKQVVVNVHVSESECISCTLDPLY